MAGNALDMNANGSLMSSYRSPDDSSYSKGYSYAKGGMDIAEGAYSLLTSSSASDNDIASVQLQQEQEEIQARQQGLARARNIRQIMANQTVMSAARGVSAASPSVQTVSRSSYDAFQRDNDVEALNISMSQTMAAQKIRAIKARQEASEFGAIGSIAMGIFAIGAAAFTGGGSLLSYSAMAGGAASAVSGASYL